MPARSRNPLTGPPPTMPAAVDAALERWWSWGPRARMLVGGAFVSAVVVALATATAADRWGPPVDVVVATRDLAPGEVPGPGALRVVQRPQATRPDDAVADVDEVAAPLIAPVPRGAALIRGHLGEAGPLARLRNGSVGVALPADTLPTLRVGQVVDVLASDPQGEPGVLAAYAEVLAAAGDHVWLAVDREQAAGVAAAASWGAVGVAVHPPAARKAPLAGARSGEDAAGRELHQ